MARTSHIAAVGQEALPIQAPVDEPIICKPYDEPDRYWDYDRATGQAVKQPGRRLARYWYKTEAQVKKQGVLELDEDEDELVCVNALRKDVKRWRDSGYEGATHITKDLLRHWAREDRPRRLFFCQREAVETVIFLTEIRGAGKDGLRRQPRFKPEFADEDFAALRDIPNEPDGKALIRYGCKMATGTGKTVVMSLLIAWAFCNRGQSPTDIRFPRAVVVCCPNLTVKDRLQVLRPDISDNYYAAFDLVPAKLRPLMAVGRVLVTNWHQFRPESPNAEGGKTYMVVNKGPEGDEAFARRILGDLYDAAPIMVLNDEAHHAYRPAPLSEIDAKKLTKEEQSEREEATLWVSGLDRLNRAVGIDLCVDLSATPFYLKGSGYAEGSPFPWLVSDFGLVDAIESGLVKIPRLPVSDATGRPDSQFIRLYRTIVDSLPAADLLTTGRARKPKPAALWREAQPALSILASQWKERFQYLEEAAPGQEKTPPVLILVCDNTDVAEFFYERISGERVEDGKTVWTGGGLVPDFENSEGFRPTLRIDSKMLAQAESDEGGNRKDAAVRLREIVATVGKPGQPGEHIRCVVSVSMLTEGWDASNVTQILGLRPFLSQLLCEQVVGRGLRRMDYAVNAEGYLEPEYVDVYGIPFSVIPYKGRPTNKPQPVDKPKNHVKPVEGREGFKLRFPIVEGYVYDLHNHALRANVDAIEPLEIEPHRDPTDVFVLPAVGYHEGHAHQSGPGEGQKQDRQEFYKSTHLQTLEFAIARDLVDAYASETKGGRHKARHLLFPQVYRIVNDYIKRKIITHGVDKRELALDKYRARIIERLLAAIEPDEDGGELPLRPLLNRYKPYGSTSDVDFKTTRPCRESVKSHLNQVVLDTVTWESSAAFHLEHSPCVHCYVRNEQMGFLIPYEYTGVTHHYEPDFLVRLSDGRMLILEIKGYENDQTRAKHAGADRWVRAVNHADKQAPWLFHVCRDPQMLKKELEYLMSKADG